MCTYIILLWLCVCGGDSMVQWLWCCATNQRVKSLNLHLNLAAVTLSTSPYSHCSGTSSCKIGTLVGKRAGVSSPIDSADLSGPGWTLGTHQRNCQCPCEFLTRGSRKITPKHWFSVPVYCPLGMQWQCYIHHLPFCRVCVCVCVCEFANILYCFRTVM